MPFKEVNISKIIQENSEKDPEFKQAFQEATAELDLIAQVIKIRKSKGLTQRDVADRSGLTQQMVSRIERRDYPPNYKNLVKIADALDSKLQLSSQNNIDVREVYRFALTQFLKQRSEEEARFILAAASIANDMQLIIFNIDRVISTNDDFTQEAFFFCRLAFFRIYEALKVFEGNIKLLERIDSEALQKYIDIRSRFKKNNRSLFKWLHDDAITNVRDAFVHCRLEQSDFLQTNQKMNNDMSLVYSYANRGLNKPELVDMNWVHFVFAEDFYSSHFVISVDPNIDLSNGEHENIVIGEITKEINEGLGIISALCSMIVRNYMQKCFGDIPEGLIIYSPQKGVKTNPE